MNILHVVAGPLHFGATRAAYAIHSALRRKGTSSWLLLSQDETVNDPSVIQIEMDEGGAASREFRSKLDRFPLECYPNRMSATQHGGMFSTGVAGIRLEELLPYKEADIVHFHWVNGLISIEGVRTIAKPVVWTLHDMWPFTGGCHYSGACTKFRSGCGCCPQLASEAANDLSALNLKRKANNFDSGIYLVAVSDWVRMLAQDSIVFRDTGVRTIPNCVDVETFVPMPKNVARNMLGLPGEKRIILFGAIQAVKDSRKGFGQLLQALRNLSRKPDCLLAIFGSAPKEVPDFIAESGLEYNCFGHIQDDQLLAALYSAADLFVAPSLQETFGRTIIESMSCGTPVVAFDCTGPKEIISHLSTGYLARPYEPEDLKNGIEWILRLNKQSYDRMSRLCRQVVEEKYSYDIVADQYLALYSELLNGPVPQRGERSRLEPIVRGAADPAGDSEIGCGNPVELLKREIEEGDPRKFPEKTFQFFRMYADVLQEEKAEIYLWDQGRLAACLRQVAAGREIAVFGAGAFAKKLYRQLYAQRIRISCFVDNDAGKWGKYLEGHPIVPLQEARDAFLVVASAFHPEITEQLLQSGRQKGIDFIVVK